jgi:hypothetical protein
MICLKINYTLNVKAGRIGIHEDEYDDPSQMAIVLCPCGGHRVGCRNMIVWLLKTLSSQNMTN